MDSDLVITKSIILAVVAVILGGLFFAYKVEACKNTPENCHDTFKPSSDYEVKCDPGAVAEMVKEPKAGVICHCVRNIEVDAGK